MACAKTFSRMAKDIITIQKPVETNDAYGGRSTTWTDFKKNIHAIITPMNGREIYSQQQSQSRVTHKFTIRYDSDLNNTKTAARNRITFSNRVFYVKFTINLYKDRKREGTYLIDMFCEENAAGME